MFLNKKLHFILLFLCFCVSIFWAGTADAAIPKLLPACIESGNCTLNDMADVFGNVARIILGITGSFALLMFVLGGFYWLTAAGVKDRVDKGQKIITGAVIGIIIIFGAYVGVQFFMRAIGAGGIAKIGTSCGSNKVYADKDGKIECITECERDHPTWSCQTKTEVGGGTKAERETQAAAIGCETGLCPGASNVVCCERE